MRNVLSIAEIGSENIARLVDRSLEFANGDDVVKRPLEGKMVGLYFRGSSTRTRTAFTVAAVKLGATTIAYGPTDLQIATGETVQDTARVLAGFLDALVIRTNDKIDEMQAFAAQDHMAVINAMSDNEHPTQAIADLATMKEHFGRLDGLHVLYVGEGNNSAASLALAAAQIPGMRLTLITPEGYGLADSVVASCVEYGKKFGSTIEHHHDMDRLPKNVDVVYATRWQTMGVPKTEPDWEKKFAPYTVTQELMARVSKPSGTIFLHDLPAVRGADVVNEVLDGPQSRAFRQAEHKLTSAMAVLEWCLKTK
ncbi:MAG TPA: ornithine carbamoyltransferase [Blastocatellia bacterium]|nr:ornithine carbamoyltransferase [Blastocatellia bacterium]